jgi:hypothetical protein
MNRRLLWWSPNRKPIRRYMSFGSLSEMERALYAIRVPTVDRTRLSRTRPSVSGGTTVRRPASSQPQNSGAIDHWSIVLLYSMGFGTVAVAALLFLVLMVVCLYGQLVWSFTYWDLANVRLTPFKRISFSWEPSWGGLASDCGASAALRGERAIRPLRGAELAEKSGHILRFFFLTKHQSA